MVIDLEQMGKDIGRAVSTTLNNFGLWAIDHPDAITITAVGLIAGGVSWGIMDWYSRRKTRGEAEEMATRQAELDQLYADMIHDMMFGLLEKDKISRQEYRRDLQRFGIKHKLGDIIRKRTHPSATRARVKKNIAKMKEDLSKVQPGAIPGPKPGEVVPVPPVKRLRWIAKGKTLPPKVA